MAPSDSLTPFDVTLLDLENLLGTLMAGTWTNTMLYACELYFTYMRLFENSGRESYWTQFGLVVMMVIDTVSSGAGCATVWDYTVLSWGDVAVLNPNNSRTLPAHICTIATSLAAVAFHVFQAVHAQQIIQHNHRKLRLALFLLWPCALVPLIGNTYAWILNASTAGGSRQGWNVGFILSAVTDGAFALFMLTVLLANRKHHLVSPDSVSAHWSATSWAIVIGLPSTLLSVTMVILRQVLVQNNIEIALALNLGRVHTLSMLFVIYRDSGELSLEAPARPVPKVVVGGVELDGVVVDVKTQHRVEISREEPLAAVRLGGLSEGMAPYSARERKMIARGRMSEEDEDDF